jgi:hypothetical protein
MLRPQREAAKSRRGQLLAHCAPVQCDAEARLDPAMQVCAPKVPPRRSQDRGLCAPSARVPPSAPGSARRGSGQAAIRQPLQRFGPALRPGPLAQPFGIAPVNPIPERLPLHSAGPGRSLAVNALQHPRDHRTSSCRLRIRCFRRRGPKPARRHVLACDRNRHRSHLASMSGNHGDGPKASPRESRNRSRWYQPPPSARAPAKVPPVA